MEKARLLEELTVLKSLIKSHEVPTKACNQTLNENPRSSVQSTSFRNKLINNQTNRDPSPKEYKNMIFLNPKKLNSSSIESKNVDKASTQYHPQKCQTGTNNGKLKVFFNPNFNIASSVLGSQTVPKISGGEKHMCCLQKETNLMRLDSTKKNSDHYKQHQNKLCGYQQLKQRELTAKTGTLNQASLKSSSVLPNRTKIFVNPEFALPKRDLIKKGISTSFSQKSDEMKLNSIPKNSFVHTQGKQNDNIDKQSLGSDWISGTSSTSTVSAINEVYAKPNSDKKRKVYLNCYKPAEATLVNNKKRKLLENKVTSSKTIFINPRFNKKIQISRGICNLDHVEDCTSLNKRNKPQTNVLESLPVSANKEINSLLMSVPHASTSSTVLSFPKLCIEGQDHGKEDKNKNSSQRNRTRSTCLVSVSPTKLIRRRKSSQNVLGVSTKPNVNKTVYLSQNKLVQCTPKKSVSSGIISKTRVIRAVQKIHAQILTPEKISKLRKQSFTNSIANLTNIVPKSTVVAKIKSKNGKSLKLIRKNLEPKNKQSPDCSRVSSSSILQKRKLLLKQHVHRNTLCIVQNKWKKSQFSKINVPTTKKPPVTVGHNKYVYKIRDSSPRKNTKFPIIDKKLNYTTKASDRSKVLKSKYSFVRKQAPNSINKSRRLSKDNKLIKPNAVLSSTSKKWKQPNSLTTGNFKRKQLSIVNIGGVFYRCSRTSLTRNKTGSKKVLQVSHKGPLLNIRGQRFQLENNGQTLTCLDKKPGRKRIDIGGVTFISSSSGTSLTRTNYHTARSILVQAKQKSISLLTRQLKKNNEPCPFYHRLGLCSGKESGTCDRQHDPKYVAVCKKFVQGSCSEPQCLLSHTISCHNMPTCQHFLAGHCSRDNCLYPHIKVSDNAPICLDFLKGFCSLGDQCPKRHLELCPSFEKGTCPRGKYCPYPHPKSKSNKKLKGKFKYLKKEPQPPRISEPVSSTNLRYFEDENLKRENRIQLLEDAEISEAVCTSEHEEERRRHPLKNRPRLGRLPSFIPLSLDES